MKSEPPSNRDNARTDNAKKTPHKVTKGERPKLGQKNGEIAERAKKSTAFTYLN
jgi:hypothetical protein